MSLSSGESPALGTFDFDCRFFLPPTDDRRERPLRGDEGGVGPRLLADGRPPLRFLAESDRFGLPSLRFRAELERVTFRFLVEESPPGISGSPQFSQLGATGTVLSQTVHRIFIFIGPPLCGVTRRYRARHGSIQPG